MAAGRTAPSWCTAPPVGDGLRAGQVVEFEWTEPGDQGFPFRALRVSPREDLQATLGG